MAFQIITDPDKLEELRQAGLLWWVGPDDGGDASYVQTCAMHRTEYCTRDWFAEPGRSKCFGILLEE